jgi:thioredoxin-related protein
MFIRRNAYRRPVLFVALVTLITFLSGCQDVAPPTPVAKTPAASTAKPTTTVIVPGEAAIAAKPATEATPAEPQSTDSKPTAADAKPAKPKRAPIYIEEPNGKELIAAALKKAKRDHKHVLVEWGGNWCGWCYKLHDVFHKNEDVQPIVFEEFELVLIDCGPNDELMKEYGGKDRQYSYPHLTILDEEGKVLTNQETGSLEEGDHHVPKLVSDFLNKWTPAKIDAEKLLSDSLAKAAAENKKVIVRIGDPYCGWCNVLAQFMQDHQSLFATDYIDIKIDTMRMTGGKEVADKLNPQKEYKGRPWIVILDSSGKTLSSSFGPEGNIGHPYQPNEIAHFIKMLKETRQNITDEDLKTIEADLHKVREEQEAKKPAGA